MNGKRYYLIVLMIFLSISVMYFLPGKTDSNSIPSTVAFVVEEPDLIPEGITYDPATTRFFLGSKNKDKVIAVYPDGKHRDFIRSGQDGLLSNLGMKMDFKRRRFWVVSNRKYGNVKKSAVHVFHADTGKLIHKFQTPAGKQFHLNDLILTTEGGAYITDTQSSHLFRVPPDLTQLEIFSTDPIISSPNGIAIAPDNSFLYLESHDNGILLVDLITKSISKIGNPMSVNTGGIDGLVYHKNCLYGVVNAQYEEYQYIVRYCLSRDGRKITGSQIIDEDNPEFITPTTCVIVDDTLYVLAATCLRVFNRNKMDQQELLHPPTVLKYCLKK